MKYTQRGFIVQGVIAIIALVLIASGAYYVSQKDVVVPVAENVYTTDWKMYTGKDFTFQYPGTVAIDDSKEGQVYVRYTQPRNDLPEGGFSLAIIVEEKNLEEILSHYRAAPVGDYANLKTSAYKLNNIDATLIEYDSAIGLAAKEIFILKNGKNYLIKTGLSEEDSQAILSTLTFTSLPAATVWKTYTNEKLGFEIKYPSDWEVNLNTGNSSVELVNSARKGKPNTDTPREVVSIDTIGTGGKITDCRSTGWVVGLGNIFYKNICVSENLGINMWMSAFDEKGKEVVDSIISTFNFPSSPAAPSEPLPLITSISPTAGPIGTRVELKGTGFSGFEGDKYAWIENPKTGVKGIIYNEAGATNNLIPFVLKDKYCTRDNSYSGNPCESYLTITPGEYTIHVYPWGKISNKIKFTVTN